MLDTVRPAGLTRRSFISTLPRNLFPAVVLFEMKKIPLTQNLETLIDDGDYARVSAHSWCAQKFGCNIYAKRKEGGHLVLLHRYLMRAPQGTEVHHMDGDGLNNQKSNLRLATRSENMAGFQRKQKDCSSRFRGVSWYPRYQRWVSKIGIRGRRKHLGYFDAEETAARAYDAAAHKHFGEFASPNFLA